MPAFSLMSRKKGAAKKPTTLIAADGDGQLGDDLSAAAPESALLVDNSSHNMALVLSSAKAAGDEPPVAQPIAKELCFAKALEQVTPIRVSDHGEALVFRTAPPGLGGGLQLPGQLADDEFGGDTKVAQLAAFSPRRAAESGVWGSLDLQAEAAGCNDGLSLPGSMSATGETVFYGSGAAGREEDDEFRTGGLRCNPLWD